MKYPFTAAASLAAIFCLASAPYATACCPVVAADQFVVNADQSVIMIWDQQSKTQHFIRKADFKTNAPDLGFIVPSPSRPLLDESGNEAFDQLRRITAPTMRSRGIGVPFACSAAPGAIRSGSVQVIEEKRVAGFDATVLTARTGEDLVEWLQQNGYPYSPAIADWARPYLGGNWHFTALKMSKQRDQQLTKELKAAALRISFKTARPLFPYREPDSDASSRRLNAPKRLLRIHFIADNQYEGSINGKPWSGRTVWSGDISEHRKSLLKALNLPSHTGPKRWWLTEIEDWWPYERAAGDVYFSPVENPRIIDRDGTNRRVRLDASLLVMLLVCGHLFGRHLRRRA